MLRRSGRLSAARPAARRPARARGVRRPPQPLLDARSRGATARPSATRADRARLPVSLLASPVQRKRYLRERVWPRVPAKPLALFVYMYLCGAGFSTAAPGLALCVFHAFQEFMVGLKLAELRRLSSLAALTAE